ncbi:jg27160, partial [Pararge aegeria aegeria]
MNCRMICHEVLSTSPKLVFAVPRIYLEDFIEPRIKPKQLPNLHTQPIIDAINACPDLQYLTLTGNTLGVEAAQAISKALTRHPELKTASFSDMFTGRMKTEIPPAL